MPPQFQNNLIPTPPVNNQIQQNSPQKHTRLVLLVAAMVMVGVLAAGYFWYLNTQTLAPTENQNLVETPLTNQFADWQIYKNHFYQFRYPTNWKISITNSDTISIEKNDGSKFPDSISIQNSLWYQQPVFNSLEDSVAYAKQKLPSALISNVKEIALDNGRAFYSDNYQENPGVNNYEPPAAILVSPNTAYYLYFLPVFYNDPTKDPKEQEDEKLILDIISTFKFDNPIKYDDFGFAIYTDSQYGFEIKYPADENVAKLDTSDVIQNNVGKFISLQIKNTKDTSDINCVQGIDTKCNNISASGHNIVMKYGAFGNVIARADLLDGKSILLFLSCDSIEKAANSLVGTGEYCVISDQRISRFKDLLSNFKFIN